PVEVAQGLEAADMRALKATLEAAAGAFVLLPLDERRSPPGGDGLRPMRQEAVQTQGLGAGLQGVRIRHDPPSSAGRRYRGNAAARPCRVRGHAPVRSG